MWPSMFEDAKLKTSQKGEKDTKINKIIAKPFFIPLKLNIVILFAVFHLFK